MSESAQCFVCKNFIALDADAHGTCKAFPDGIPTELLDSMVKHTNPYPGDRGILYESRFADDEPEELNEPPLDIEGLKKYGIPEEMLLEIRKGYEALR